MDGHSAAAGRHKTKLQEWREYETMLLGSARNNLKENRNPKKDPRNVIQLHAVYHIHLSAAKKMFFGELHTLELKTVKFYLKKN